MTIALALLAAPLAYLLLALVGGTIAVKRDFTPTPLAAGGVPIYVRTNGVHADLALPLRRPHDWADEFPPGDVLDADAPAPTQWRWIAFGWGDRGFYLNTPRWRDLRASTAWIAISGQGSGAMHVEYVGAPEHFLARRVDIDRAQYDRLVAFVRAAFVRDAAGRPRRIDHPGFDATDAFYEGAGRYTLVFTSNDWVRAALAASGVRTALWAPFDAPLLWHLPAGGQAATIRIPAARAGRAAEETR